ncbi:hypothetical protein [Macrococcus capreoli]|uniref:hypothetical protein n=1 Tax=Macrococcus capreoli TaxID=2982690 RepID=UPI0021D5DA37|nr:hypothetical protein [Macrococcus sp. TMW 2.2395]MCU7557955.1 hypothetical protein [Macrococcus sp. TMW 2.2395]
MKIKNKEELNKAKKAAMKIVQQRSTASGAIAAIPIPGVDLAADVGLIMEVVNKVNRKFGLSHEEIEELDADEKQKVLVIVTSIGNQFVGKVLTKELVTRTLKKIGIKKVTQKQVAKYIPFAGAAISGGISYAAMYSLGKNHVEECYEICLQLLEENNK